VSTLAIPDYRDLLGSLGDPIAVGGNTPFVIEGAGHVWIVEAGRVELFAVPLDEGRPAGARRHYLTAQPGDLIFGMNFADVGAGYGLLAVGAAGTTLRRVPLDAMRQLAQDPSHAPAVHDGLERWVDGLSAGVARAIASRPPPDHTVECGQTVELTAGQRVSAAQRMVWARHAEGEMLLFGLEPIADAASTVPAERGFPLSPHAFLEARDQVRLLTCTTHEALVHDDGWDGLTGFYRVLFACERHSTALIGERERTRLQQKAARDRRAREQAVRDLAGVLEPQGAAIGAVDTGDALLAAVALVGSRVGVHVRPAPQTEDAARLDPLTEIARTSRFRTRRVLLRGSWWRKETTPLLAYKAADHAPVALLPVGHGRVNLHDPRDGTVVRVTTDVATSLEPIAFQFYRPFPEGLREATEVLTFGLEGATHDLWRPLAYALIGGLLALLTPQITGRIVDKVIPDASSSELVQMVAILAAVAFASAMLDVARRLGLLRLETKMSAAVAPAIWDRLISLPVSFFRTYNAGDLAQRVGGVDRIRQTLSGATTTTLMLSLFSLLYLVQMFYYNWQLGLLAVGLVTVVLVVIAICAVVKLRATREVVRAEGRISGLVLQLLTGIPKLRVAAAEARAFAEWARAFGQQKQLASRGDNADVAITVFNSAFAIVTSICLFALMWHLTKTALGNGGVPLSIGDFVAFNAAFAILLAQTLQMGLGLMTVMSVVPLFERSRPILTAIPEVDPTKSDPGDLTGRIDVSHVSFRYTPDGPRILDDVSIEIPAGKFIAIVGPSGSGKSTLLRLILGLESPESGAVYYDGRDLSQIDVQKLRRKLGVVVQNGRIRQGSILENIVGSQPLTIDAAWEAARLAGLEEDVERMPMGMHTVLQQGGGQLSGGQRQRLMIARAIVNRPRIVLLDEATSALDNRTQAIVAEGMRRMQATRVAIAHRLSTIIDADRIIVMAGGRVVQSGTYQELVNQDGLFADLVKRQVA
jgi:NHLM bacteriocin system ABC transporter ATP-binding protein